MARMDFNRALAEISALKGQMARSTEFRGFGPATIAVTGVLGLAVGFGQAHLVSRPVVHIDAYLTLWILTAALAIAAISLETISRTQREHPALVREMILNATMHFVPAIAAGILLTVVLLHSSPASAWMLPGLWQIMFSLGVFSSCQRLPRAMIAVGIWYVVCGLLVLATDNPGLTLSGPAMGIPFGIGQLLVASILYRGYLEYDEDGQPQA